MGARRERLAENPAELELGLVADAAVGEEEDDEAEVEEAEAAEAMEATASNGI